MAKQVGIDPAVIRIMFVALVFAGGLGVVLYVVLWLLVPVEGETGRSLRIPELSGRAGVEVAVGVGLLLLSLLLTLRALGVWWSDVLTWPVVLVAAGGALLWREAGARSEVTDEVTDDPEEEAVAVASRTGLGVALVVA